VCPRARNFSNCVSFTHSSISCSAMHSSDGLSSASEVRAKARAIDRILEISCTTSLPSVWAARTAVTTRLKCVPQLLQ
jgi:hypothetical protein